MTVGEQGLVVLQGGKQESSPRALERRIRSDLFLADPEHQVAQFLRLAESPLGLVRPGPLGLVDSRTSLLLGDGDQRGRNRGRDPDDEERHEHRRDGCRPLSGPSLHPIPERWPTGQDRLPVRNGSRSSALSRGGIPVPRVLLHGLEDDRFEVVRHCRVDRRRSGGGSSWMIWLMRTAGSSLGSDTRPVSSSYRVAASEYTSVRWSSRRRSPPACSGLMCAQSADRRAGPGDGRADGELGEPEIGDPDVAARVEEEVRWFHIPVDNPALMGVVRRRATSHRRATAR